MNGTSANISYFSCHCDKIPDRNNLKEEGFILASDFRF
jgi:hypothetical protein